jgi:hypothetical protein
MKSFVPSKNVTALPDSTVLRPVSPGAELLNVVVTLVVAPAVVTTWRVGLVALGTHSSPRGADEFAERT